MHDYEGHYKHLIKKRSYKDMKKKITAVLLVAALVLSFGLVPVSPVMAATTIVVPGVHLTIQAAINAAGTDDTIQVKTGTYTEDLTIPAGKDNLVLEPFGDGPVTIKGVQMSLSTTWPAALPNIEILSDGVKLHGFTIQGPDPVSGSYSSGVIIGGSNVEIYDNAFEVTNSNDGTGADVSQGLQTYNKRAIPGVDISGLNIHDNTFTHHGTGSVGFEAIYINRDEGTGVATIADNDFTGNVVRGITTERSNTTISGNTLATGASLILSGILVMDVGGYWDTGCENQDAISITGNSITGFSPGIKIGPSNGSQVLTNVNITGNDVQNNTIGIKVRSSADGVVINFNNIMNNSTFGVENTDSDNDLDATKNWWGHASGPSGDNGRVTKKGKVIGKGDAVSADVNWKPWLPQPIGHTKHDPVPPGLE
jgi:hypothetical protein